MADSALQYATAFNPQMMISAYENIYLASKANGDSTRGLNAYEKMVAIRDSLFSVEKNNAITELEKKYNQAKNENTIRDLSKKKQIYLLLSIAGILALLAIGFYVRQQSLKHKKVVLETEQRLNQARMNPHFFFNTLTTLQKLALQENHGEVMAGNLARSVISCGKHWKALTRNISALNRKSIFCPNTWKYKKCTTRMPFPMK